jgi:LmbE family N-acetylglucosaminyl deacetylase
MNVLVIAAHPDDEALGCGGAIAVHAARGDMVDIVFVADGETSRDSAAAAKIAGRRSAADAAAAILGARPPRFLDLPDNRLDGLPTLDVVKALAGATSDLAPDLVYTHHDGDLNVDHRVVCRATVTLYRPLPDSTVTEIRGFEVLSSTGWSVPAAAFAPTCFVDISATLGKKLAALRAYQGEMRAFPHARSFEAVEALARFRGAVAGLAAAEAFTIYRRVERAASPGR